MKRRAFLLSVAVILLALVPVRAANEGRCGEWSNIYVFGDSLSDNGNFVKILGPLEQYNPYHYWQGRYSNGPVWTEYLARELHANLLDFAVGTATTGESTHGAFYPYVPTILDQVRSFRASRVNIPADSLFIIQGGGNDFIQEVLTGGDPGKVPGTAVANLMTGVALLEKAGAKHILVLGMPDVGKAPAFKYYPGLPTYLSMLAVAYNQALADAVRDFTAANHHIAVSFVDMYGFMAGMAAKPQKYGLTNVTDESPNATIPNQFESDYLYWDWVHPTTKVHQESAAFVAKAADRLERRGEDRR